MTKRELAEKYDISLNTVTATIKACGLDTAKQSYTTEEIEERFKPARDLLANGYTYKDVEEFFQVKNAEPFDGNGIYEERPTDEVEVSEDLQVVHDTINREIEAGLGAMVQGSVQRYVQGKFTQDVTKAFAIECRSGEVTRRLAHLAQSPGFRQQFFLEPTLGSGHTRHEVPSLTPQRDDVWDAASSEDDEEEDGDDDDVSDDASDAAIS